MDAIIHSEGGYNPDGRGWTVGGDAGQSWGAWQLYYGGGLGNAFTRDTGLNAWDRDTWEAQADWCLALIVARGAQAGDNWDWLASQWHGLPKRRPGVAVDDVGGGDPVPIIEGGALATWLLVVGLGVLIVAIGSRR